MPQKLQTVQGGCAFSLGRLFCSCIHSPVTSFPLFKSSSCLLLKILVPLFLSVKMWPSNDCRLSARFHLSYCLKLSWKNDLGRRFSSADLVRTAEEMGSKRWTWENWVSKQDISEREEARLKILNRDVDVLGWGSKNACVHWNEWVAFPWNVSCK